MAKLTKGSNVSIRNRLWAVVDKSGKLYVNEDHQSVSVFATRTAADNYLTRGLPDDRLVRLDDVRGVVIK